MKYLICIENDERNISFIVDAQDGVDVMEACRRAACEYLSTPEGMDIYEGNCDSFTWADFEAYIPDEICEKYGFRVVRDNVHILSVDGEEQLTHGRAFLVSDIEWDTDGEEVEYLPESCIVPFLSLLAEDEHLDDCAVPFPSLLMKGEHPDDINAADYEEINERITDYLSDSYGFCLSGFSCSVM